MPPESGKESPAPGPGEGEHGLQVLFMVLGRDSSWQVPSGWVDEVLHHARGSSLHLQPGLQRGRRQRCLGTWPRTGSRGRGTRLLAMVAQQGCGGEEGLALEGAMSMGLSSFLLQAWGGKGHWLIRTGKNGWKVRRLAVLVEGESLLCRQLRFLRNKSCFPPFLTALLAVA